MEQCDKDRLTLPSVICLTCGLKDKEKITRCIAEFEAYSSAPNYPGYPCTLEKDNDF